GAVVLVVAGGITAVRADSLADFMRFIGVRGHETPTGVESYSQRTVLAYIGFRIFEDHPVLGVGWQRSSRPDVFEPYLADARRRFPDVVALAFPSAASGDRSESSLGFRCRRPRACCSVWPPREPRQSRTSRVADPRLDPPYSMPTYAVRGPLVRWLTDEAKRAHTDLGSYRVLDV